MKSAKRPVVLAGPCMAESLEIMLEVADRLLYLSQELEFDYYFKASFDKANRSSINSYRGPGLEQVSKWFETLKNRFDCRIITDIHEPSQAREASHFCDALQIPAFLCRQTDLIVAAAKTGLVVNIKKGQFMAPGAMQHIVQKAISTCKHHDLPTTNCFLTERGSSFGYGDLLVDMRSIPVMAKHGTPVLFDCTHSTQAPPTSAQSHISNAHRNFTPILARAAVATGYLSGFFLETHPKPAEAKSDAAAQLDLDQCETLLRQLIPLWRQAQEWQVHDKIFTH